jgi:hypothetical protein
MNTAIYIFLTVLSAQISLTQTANADGFNADNVKLSKEANGAFKITVWYTHLQIGERRQAHMDFTSLKEATDFYIKLRNGADFFLGDPKKGIHFHNQPIEKSPW